MVGDARVLVAAVAAGAFVAQVVHLLIPPPRRLATRLVPYTQAARFRLGTGQPETALLEASRESRSSLDLVFGPLLRRAASALAAYVDVGGQATTVLRLRQAGLDVTVEQYRMRQLGYAVGCLAAGFGASVLSGRSTAVVLIMSALSGLFGATYWRSRVAKAIERRRELMRVELYTVCQLLALYSRTTDGGPTGAVRQTVARCVGPVSKELDEALALIERGQAPSRAYTHIARVTPEPTAARLYRILAASARGGDAAPALLALANTIRGERREDLARLAARRRVAMVFPMVAVMAPVMILFIAAAIPSLLFTFR